MNLYESQLRLSAWRYMAPLLESANLYITGNYGNSLRWCACTEHQSQYITPLSPSPQSLQNAGVGGAPLLGAVGGWQGQAPPQGQVNHLARRSRVVVERQVGLVR